MKIWLDDERNPKEKIIKERYQSEGDETWVKNVEDAIAYIEKGCVTSISLDHDLGENKKTGYFLAKWIEEKAFLNEIKPFKTRVHSSNPSGAKQMKIALAQAEKFWLRYHSDYRRNSND